MFDPKAEIARIQALFDPANESGSVVTLSNPGEPRLTLGLVDRTQIHPREVFRSAIRENCSRVLLVHSHPSGDPTPSAQDIAATRQLVEAGKIVGIDVLDRVILGSRTERLSFP